MRTEERRADHADRLARYVRLVHDEDILGTFNSTPDDLLVAVGAGLAVAAMEGAFDSTAWTARTMYGIPRDAVELLAAAYLATVMPYTAAAFLARPTEGDILEVRRWLRARGIDARVDPPLVVQAAVAARGASG